MHTIKKIIIILLLTAIPLTHSFSQIAQAAVISTESILNLERQSPQDELRTILAREDVKKELIGFGVDPDYADRRIAAMTDDELSQLRSRIGELPAGSSALAVLGAVFLVLIVLELVGVTNVFSKL